MSRDDGLEALLDVVLDLQHDLGKYLRLPLRMLPRDASDADVRAALREALLTTRRTAAGVRSARAIWEALADDAERHGAAAYPSFARVREAVARALAWEDAARADAAGPVARADADADFAAVTDALAALREEVERG